jgi:hypothetical protein
MNDEVRQAAFIGAAINSGLGLLPTGKKKKLKDKEDKNTTQTESTSTETEETKDSSKTSKSSLETSTEPTFVKSNNPKISKQFTGYTGMYGTDNQPPIDLSKF